MIVHELLNSHWDLVQMSNNQKYTTLQIISRATEKKNKLHK